MDRKTGFEDIENGPREVEENEESWFKKTKIKFKAGENSQIDSEEDEKKGRMGKGKRWNLTKEKIGK